MYGKRNATELTQHIKCVGTGIDTPLNPAHIGHKMVARLHLNRKYEAEIKLPAGRLYIIHVYKKHFQIKNMIFDLRKSFVNHL